MQAQITIGGNVYGGGNEGNVEGSTAVTVHAGDLNNVFGGARKANVEGSAFVNIDGEHASDYIIINKVYGGNDISGTISGTNVTVPTELTKTTENKIDDTWNAFVRISTRTETVDGKVQETSDAQKIYIGQLFGGGNGDYDYTSDDSPYKGLTNPVLGKTYLEICGGSIVYAYGGGNNATVNQSTVICVDNPSKVVNSITDASAKTSDNPKGELLTNARFKKMGINTGFSYPNSDAYQIGRFFGGNNKTAMAIRPIWNLLSGKIRNLYSGGNMGDMNSPDGLLLQIPATSTIEVDNVFGGCRMADVVPKDANGNEVTAANITQDYFGNLLSVPGGYSARTRILGGRINNVYGGNDVSGRIKGGCTVGIYTSIFGDVYGGGNGSYPYTDNALLKDDDIYGDLYYTIPDGKTSVEALNAFRPNAEQVSILVTGADNGADKPTIIHGSIYCGGNSASLASDKTDPTVELKIGPYVIADNVFLGNNGENMVKWNEKDEAKYIGEGVLRTMKSTSITSDGSKFNSMDLTDSETFAAYMDGVSMPLVPSVVFANGDPTTYKDYTSYFGSIYCGGNVGSMKIDGKKTTLNFNKEIIVYNKVVGGCNNANVAASDYNAAYEGGLLGAPDGNGDKLELNLSGLKIQPKRWVVKRDDDYNILYYNKDVASTDPTKGEWRYIPDEHDNAQLEWNTVYASTGKDTEPVTSGSGTSNANDKDRRLKGGNVYGGCYNSGHVNGNVVININNSIIERDKLFDEADEGDTLYENTEKKSYNISKRNTGVILSEQGMDALGAALNVFGGGYGKESEIWGSTTINLNKGYVFQIFGGGEMGAIGKSDDGEGEDPISLSSNGKTYKYNSKYSTTINLNGDATLPGVERGKEGDSPNMAECEFIYGGAFEGLIAGNTKVNLNNGRIFNSFAGSCNADILGHSETYVGQNGFPWIRDHIYGGNDLGGRIMGQADFYSRIRKEVRSMVDGNYGVASYMEYTQGRVRNILGGCFGNYDYTDDAYKVGTGDDYRVANKPYMRNTFVNIRPIDNANSSIERVFGAGEGSSGDRDGDKLQDHSYVLIDIPDDIKNFAKTEIFGAGAYNGLGMRYPAAETFASGFDLNEASAVIDLLRGRVGAAYGGSLDEGVTRRTIVNVPKNSTIIIDNIFGGAFGNHILPPCDVYEANVNYNSSKAFVNGNIYGGNNNVRRTLYAKVNISVPVVAENGFTARVYGAGKGMETWAEYTEVNLLKGANVWEAYGGGELGNVLNSESIEKYMQAYMNQPAGKLLEEDEDDENWNDAARWEGGVGGTLKEEWKETWKKEWKAAWTLGDYYTPSDNFDGYYNNDYTNLNNPLVRKAEMDDRDYTAYSDEEKAKRQYKYNTNVIVHEGATIGTYAYGGGYGDSSKPMSGSVYGTTYFALLGGTVGKDVYAAGTAGSVNDPFGADAYSASNPGGFTASANIYVKGGIARNVYGGGWKGSVGYHAGDISASTANDIDGETHVVIGTADGNSLTNGIPAIQRNAYAGGEGGAVFGTANITLNNGYIGYVYNPEGTDDPETVIDERYEEKITDETWMDEHGNYIPNTNLETSGNVFGGGYIDNSSVDITNVKVYNGFVRNSVFGGGEIAAIGRGDVYGENDENPLRTLKGIYKAGQTHVYIYDGHILRNVFAGGKGIDNLGRTGSLYTNGYVFGQTDVRVYGGEIGTESGVAKGYGNVFGGGDIGYVYSAYVDGQGKLGFGKKWGNRHDDAGEGYYYKSNGTLYTDNNGNVLSEGAEKYMTEDCHVLIEPHCKVKTAVTINGTLYKEGDYVPTSALNTLQDKTSAAATWNCLDTDGIIIHNAVFAGGNVSSGSDQVYANATTVFGNATASIHDVYHRDLITIGTGHTGGLYGDGNLTFVDGYRGLNITNYGTDYYHISEDISIDEYHALTDREAAYYELKYKCEQECTDNEGTHYTVGSTVAHDELIALFAGNTAIINADGTVNEEYWTENGVVSRYAGRIMNTIQRADFCGVWGSRMVMKGAQDRVPEIVDYTNYTINRVREVSLNAKRSVAGDAVGSTNYEHGNYFGIYSIVNYLGALTSDVDFYTEKRVTDNTNAEAYKSDVTIDGTTYAYGDASYYHWKRAHINDRTRNNGMSHNKVALASGVYLELTTEESTGNGLREKDWGYITGVVELDLINVQTGIGGGFVYAKNVHGVRSSSGLQRVTLTDLNQGAVSNRSFIYTTDDASQSEWQSSGNFVHSTQTIIDDCYDISGKYVGEEAVPAHYWYIKGQVYVYDQFVSAYTGAPNAYSETVNIPLTITAASHGNMKLLDVKPNRYAYYSTFNESTQTKLVGDQKLIINDVTYNLNDPISYWDWNMLNSAERRLFVEDTYVVIADCKIGSKEYAEGTVLLKEEYEALIKDGKPTNVTQKKTVNGEETDVEADFDFLFRSSNNLGHDTGYILAYNVNNPTTWNKYYTPLLGSSRDDKITSESYDLLSITDQAAYTDGPTYRPKQDGLYGQREYKVSDVITKSDYDTYQSAKASHPDAIPSSGQAEFEPAYLVKEYLETTKRDGTDQRLQEGAKLAASDYTDSQWAAMSSHVDEAYLCNTTIQLSNTVTVYNGQLMTKARMQELITTYPAMATDITNHIVKAYYCTTPGMYGGNYYETTRNYRALAAWSSMSEADRENFTFNYDALDLLIDPDYSGIAGKKYQYDGYTAYSDDDAKYMLYSLERPVDYTATYNGAETGTYNGITLQNGKEYKREEYEKLPNEQHHYSPISVSAPGTYYIVNSPFIVGETPYSVGTTIEGNTYSSLNDNDKKKITKLTFDASEVVTDGSTYYYCREDYTIGDHGNGVAVTNVKGSDSYSNGDEVPVGVVISEDAYKSLVNKQLDFTIHGIAPMETSTLFVSRNSDIFDLSKEKIITVIYEYNYEESDVSGLHITPVSERHVVNIHIQFKSGIPTVDDITKPALVLPGTAVTLRTPDVTPGAYEVTGGGWEIYEREDYAESHTNGIEYTPGSDALYWYQDGYYVAYYAQTYLGKTYSNHVPVSVANYHDLKKVMDDKKHHMYVDYDLNRLKRECKIYINDYSSNSENGLDLLKDFYDLSLLDESSADVTDGTVTADGRLNGQALLNDHVKGGSDLEFFLHSDIDHSSSPWTPIGQTTCFGGTLHGDGYTLSGLSNSLFDNLCGDVYNLGVTGSFTGAGVAEQGSGYVENCWVSTSSTEAKTSKPVFGNPTVEANSTRPYRIVNCYYQEEDNATNKYTNHTGTYGIPTPKTGRDFYNGTVAYNLNGFYLYKRYCDHELTSGTSYDYFATDDSGNLERLTSHYGSNHDLCSANYVENRMTDGDFRYADGEIPTSVDDRYYTVTDNNENVIVKYAPIWPDDYIFFGQSLTYDYTDTHKEQPTHIAKIGGRLPLGTQITQNNRVYRAPAYFGNQTMSMAHFNPIAVIAATSKPKSDTDDTMLPAYPGMTAIDFAGHNDTSYRLGANGNLFYQPLLDDDGLESIALYGETQNLLAYAPSEDANSKTYTVLNNYFAEEPAFANYSDEYTNDLYTDGYVYRRVDAAPTTSIVGHLVQSNLTATNDHLLVDLQEFNAPIGYQFDNNHRMWYQRTPQNYVDDKKGWEAVSLPFTAELVTTQTKGEITHFYEGSTTGHEYWLRSFKGGYLSTDNTFVGNFQKPAAGTEDKEFTNHFLWDYYYSYDLYHDKNTDEYQKRYYADDHTYNGYAYGAAGKPYIAGFPGSRYYEFDLSGTFVPKYTHTAVDQLPAQSITFASATGGKIGVSDTEQSAGTSTITSDGYKFTFLPNYKNVSLAVGEGYVLADDGSGFETKTTATTVGAFRPYFTVEASSGTRSISQIVFGSDYTTDLIPRGDPSKRITGGSLNISAAKGKVIVSSSLGYATDMTIFTPAGIALSTFTVEPGQTVETRVNNSGVYIVQSTDGLYTKKVAVKRE